MFVNNTSFEKNFICLQKTLRVSLRLPIFLKKEFKDRQVFCLVHLCQIKIKIDLAFTIE